MADMLSCSTKRCRRGCYFLLPFPLLVTAFLLVDFTPSVSAFSQGIQIRNNFGVYCNRPVSERYPVHADVLMCRGICQPRTDIRNFFNISLNATTYLRDGVRVSITVNPRFGFYANILGFAVIATTETDHIVGSFEEQRDALVASCDPLLEGTTAFHAFASPRRQSLTLVWSPLLRNYGRIRFRAWIVVQHNEIYVISSDYVDYELDGANQLNLHDNFFSNMLNVLNISKDVVEVVDSGLPQPLPLTGGSRGIPQSSTGSLAQRNNGDLDDRSFGSSTAPSNRISDTTRDGSSETSATGQRIGDVERSGGLLTSLTARNNRNSGVSGSGSLTAQTSGNSDVGSDDDDTNDDGDATVVVPQEPDVMTITVPVSEGTRMRLQIPTMKAFEDMFERRLMTVGFDTSADDPFEKVKRPVPLFKDLFPDQPPPPSQSVAPFAPRQPNQSNNNPFKQSFGSTRNSAENVQNIIANGPSTNQIFQQTNGQNFFGQGANPNQFGGSFGNQFAGNPFPGQFPNQFGNSFSNQFPQNGGSAFGVSTNPFASPNSFQSQNQLGFPNTGSFFQRFDVSQNSGQFPQTFEQNSFAGSRFVPTGNLGLQLRNAGNPFINQQNFGISSQFGQQNFGIPSQFGGQNIGGSQFGQQNFQAPQSFGNSAFSQQGTAFAPQQSSGSLLANTGNLFLSPFSPAAPSTQLSGGRGGATLFGQANPFGLQQQFSSGSQSPFTNSLFGQMLNNQLLTLSGGQQATNNPFSTQANSFGLPQTFSSNPFGQNTRNPQFSGQSPFGPFSGGQSSTQLSSGTSTNPFVANQFTSGALGALSSFFSGRQG